MSSQPGEPEQLDAWWTVTVAGALDIAGSAWVGPSASVGLAARYAVHTRQRWPRKRSVQSLVAMTDADESTEEGKQPDGWLVDFDLPYFISVPDSMDDEQLRAYAEALDSGRDPDPGGI